MFFVRLDSLGPFAITIARDPFLSKESKKIATKTDVKRVEFSIAFGMCFHSLANSSHEGGRF